MKAEHGTRTTYVAGCRCAKCSAANSAHAWALRKAKQWDAPLVVGGKILACKDFVADGGAMLSREDIETAIRHHEQVIKVGLLTKIWHKTIGAK